jgi:uncharacterized membrane-anchored protein
MTRRIAVAIGLLLQILAVSAVFLPAIYRLQTGTQATLRTVPVDPRSVLRGDYVILSYEAGNGLPLDWPYDKPVYVVLEPKGEIFERVRLSETQPTLLPGQICLRGSPQYNRVEFGDIAQYFVPEGEGRFLEQAQNTHRLYVEISVDANCRAVVRGVRLGPQAPLEQEAMPQRIPPPDVMIDTGTGAEAL